MNRPCSFTFQRIKSERAPLLSSPRQRLPKLFLHSLKKEISTRSNNKFLSRCFITSWTGKWWLPPNVDRSNNGKKRKRKRKMEGEKSWKIFRWKRRSTFLISKLDMAEVGGEAKQVFFDSIRLEFAKIWNFPRRLSQGANFHSEDLSDKKFRYSITDITIS